MNLYQVEYELVTDYYTNLEKFSLPSHIISSSESNALETALKYCTINFQLKRCFLLSSNVNVITEVL